MGRETHPPHITNKSAEVVLKIHPGLLFLDHNLLVFYPTLVIRARWGRGGDGSGQSYQELSIEEVKHVLKISP